VKLPEQEEGSSHSSRTLLEGPEGFSQAGRGAVTASPKNEISENVLERRTNCG